MKANPNYWYYIIGNTLAKAADSVSLFVKGVEILPDGSVVRSETNYSGKFQEAHDASKASIQSRISNLESGGVKGTGKNPEIVKFTEEQLSTKPLYSRDPEKWQKKGGKIEISEEGIWTYIDWYILPNRVSYPGGFPDFKSAGLVRQEVPIGEFNRYDIDFAKADELAPNGPKLDENTWHHHQDLTTMQEVSKEMHRRFRHMGGMSLAKKLKD
ncbi:HNH endonuclease [Bacillus cereus]|uniref:Toxin/Nuclease N-terminal domain-containing protein n=1 Tax=Bacillus cereus TaxID=1396 RepID=A0A9X8J2U9_BACCE|nr:MULTISPECIES: HNH endonuclease [Bacillus cereus group]KAA0777523.1 hypothetical protein DN404_07835 [Bacillus sp. TE8-1]MDA2177746.1 HNH endonuclease [Bacillus cereus]MEB9415372.1 HNH endonuclease [Bacillus cereus]MEB9444805.1 HNH endonuclease [Bacillus cereus]MEC3193481.1 HNH endonuclease [Bacillus cereus]